MIEREALKRGRDAGASSSRRRCAVSAFQRMKPLFTAIQFLASVAIVLGGLEILLRVYPAAIPLALLQHFEEGLRLRVAQRLHLPTRYDFLEVPRDDGGPLLRRYRPRTHVAGKRDAAGFCNPRGHESAAEQMEIIVVGDSFTECNVPAEQTWPALLQAFSGTQTYNLGVGGIGIYEYVQMLKQFGLQRRPRIVIMNIYEGNDLRDALRYWDHRNNKGGAAELGKLGSARGGWLSRHSYAVNVATAAWREWVDPAWRSLTEVEEEFKKGLDAIDKDSLDLRYVLHLEGGDVAFNQDNADRDELRLALVLDQGLIDLGVLNEALATFVQLAKDEGFLPLITYSPAAYTAYVNYIEFSEPSVGPVLARYSARLRDYFRDFADRFGVPFLDLTPDLQAEIAAQGSAQAARLLYFPNTVHYSAEGHRTVAEAVARFVEAPPDGLARRGTRSSPPMH